MTTRYRTAFAAPTGFCAAPPKSSVKASQPKAKKAADLSLRTAAKTQTKARAETVRGSEAA